MKKFFPKHKLLKLTQEEITCVVKTFPQIKTKGADSFTGVNLNKTKISGERHNVLGSEDLMSLRCHSLPN